MRKGSRTLFAVSLIVLLFVPGCLSLRRPMKRFSTQEEAGSVQVAIQSIARFDDVYIDALQPHFNVSSEEALEAIAQTQISEMQRLRALVAELSVSGAKKEGTQERTSDKGEVTKDTDTEKRTAPAIDTTAAPTAATLSLTPFTVSDQSIQLDPALQRRAAAAYLQEIALLNRYVQDAAVSRGTYPMVVRLLVTVTPSARREPYDAYTTVSLFTTGDKDYSDTIRDLKLAEDLKFGYENVLESVKRRFESQKFDTTDARKWFERAQANGEKTNCTQAVEIIPLFVTDNLESSLNNVSNQRIVNTSARGTGFWANLAASLGIRTQADDRDRSLARGLNSLYTISKLSGNTVEARFGAIAANNDYEMISRTFNVTLLALVPTAARDYTFKTSGSDAADEVLRTTIPCKRLEFVADSFFRDAVRGRQIPEAFSSLKRHRFDSMNQAWKFKNPTAAASRLENLLSFAQRDLQQQFRQSVVANITDLETQNGAFDPSLINTLWHDLVTFGRASGRSYGTFEIPLSRRTAFFYDDSASLFDDGKETKMFLGGAQNISADGLRAVVEVIGPAPALQRTTFDSNSVSMSPDERRATFKFASMSKTLGGPPSKIVSVEVRKSPGRRDWDDQTTLVWSRSVTYVADGSRPDPPEATVAMTLSSDVVRMKDGGGEVLIGFTADNPASPPTVIVDAIGGYIDTVTPPATMPNGRLELAGHGTYRLALKNLAADRKIMIRALQKDGKKFIPIGEKTLDVKTN